MPDRIRTRYMLVCYDCGHEFVGPVDCPDTASPVDRAMWDEWACPQCGGDGQPKEEAKS